MNLYGHWARLGRTRQGAATPLNPLHYPLLHLPLDPSNGAHANLYAARKSLFGFQLIDHRSAQAGGLAYLRKTQDFKVGVSHRR
jgi:hypothetical protein